MNPNAIMAPAGAEWTNQSAVHPDFRVNPGFYRHDNGTTVEVISYRQADDTVAVEVDNDGTVVHVPRPVAWKALHRVDPPRKDRTGLCAVAIIAALAILAYLVGA